MHASQSAVKFPNHEPPLLGAHNSLKEEKGQLPIVAPQILGNSTELRDATNRNHSIKCVALNKEIIEDNEIDSTVNQGGKNHKVGLFFKINNLAREKLLSVKSYAQNKYTNATKRGLLHSLVDEYMGFDETCVIAKQLEDMKGLNSPQFVEFYQFLDKTLIKRVDDEINKLENLEADKNNFLISFIKNQRNLVRGLIRVILARGFVNIGQQIQVNKMGEVEENQLSLVHIVSFLCQKVGQGLNQDQLENVEKFYQSAEKSFKDLSEELFPNKMKPETEEFVQNYIKNGGDSECLFEDLKKHLQTSEEKKEKLSQQEEDQVRKFATALISLHEKKKKLNELFGRAVNAILSSFFPNKLADIPELNLNRRPMSWLRDFLYNLISKNLTNFFQESYEALQNNAVHQNIWIEKLQCVGGSNVQLIAEMPKAFLKAFIENFIQNSEFSPQVTQMMMDNSDPTGCVANFLRGLLQGILNPDNSHFAGLRKFTKQTLMNLATAFMAKGVDFLISEKEKSIEPPVSLKKMIESFTEKIIDLRLGEFSEKTWENFFKDLPIPLPLKGLFVSYLVDKIRILIHNPEEKPALKEKLDFLLKSQNENIQKIGVEFEDFPYFREALLRAEEIQSNGKAIEKSQEYENAIKIYEEAKAKNTVISIKMRPRIAECHLTLMFLQMEEEEKKKFVQELYCICFPPTHFLTSIVEIESNKKLLEQKSGSTFLGSLCQALSRDIPKLLSNHFENDESIAETIFITLQDSNPTKQQTVALAKEISQLYAKKDVQTEDLIEAYYKVIKEKPPSDEQLKEVLKSKLEKAKLIDKVRAYSEIIYKMFPHLTEKGANRLANQVHNFFHGSSSTYLQFSHLIYPYLEGILVKIFIGIVDKNPPQNGKDTASILVENLLNKVARLDILNEKNDDQEAIVKDLTRSILEDILGLHSENDLWVALGPFQELIRAFIQAQLANQVNKIQSNLKMLESVEEVDHEKARSKKDMPSLGNPAKGVVHILAEDLAQLIVDSVPYALASQADVGGKVGEDIKGVLTISKLLESSLEDLCQKNMEVGEVLLDYVKNHEFKDALREGLKGLADPENFSVHKEKVAQLLSHLLIKPLNNLIEGVVKFQALEKQEFTQELMANLLNVAAEHFEHLRKASNHAKGESRISHESFVQVADKQLHAGLAKKPIPYTKTLNALNTIIQQESAALNNKIWGREDKQKELRDIIATMVNQEALGIKVIRSSDVVVQMDEFYSKIMGDGYTLSKRAKDALNNQGLPQLMRQEAEAANIAKQEATYAPAVRVILKILFPSGKESLTLIPKDQRKAVWDIFEKNLFPQLLSMITELILDPATINAIVLNSLESVKNSLNGEIIIEEKQEAIPQDLKGLDLAVGNLVSSLINTLTLPSWVKSKLLDRKGQIPTSMKRALGAALFKQFNEKFIKEKFEIALNTIVQRQANAEENRAFLKFIPKPPKEKAKEAANKAAQTQQDLKRVTREVVDASIAYVIRSKWAAFQKRSDELIEKVLGRTAGRKVKHTLDTLFGVVFFKIIGAIFSIILRPAKQTIKNMVYNFISLDKNRETLLGMLTQAPSDQPETFGQHVVYNENLIFRMAEALNAVVIDYLPNKEEPINI